MQAILRQDSNMGKFKQLIVDLKQKKTLNKKSQNRDKTILKIITIIDTKFNKEEQTA